MTEEHFLQSKTFRGILYGIGMVAVVSFIFCGGVFVGSRKAMFACKWGENYYRNFAGARGFLGSHFERGGMSGHGFFGSLISIKDSEIVVKGKDGIERIVDIDAKTLLQRGNNTLTVADLKVGDNVMIFGTPLESGRIDARLIRMTPTP